MSVDQTAGQSATVVLSSYLAGHAAQDPLLRDILATLGAAMGMATVPWAGAVPPIVPATVPPTSEVAEALADALKKDRAPSVGGARQKSNSRSPTPKTTGGAGKGKSSNGKGRMGLTAAQPAPVVTLEGLAQLQAALGLSGEGLPVPGSEDDV